MLSPSPLRVCIEVGSRVSSIYFKANIKAGKTVTKGVEVGAYSVNSKGNYCQKLFAALSGKVVWIHSDSEEDLLAQKEVGDSVIVAEIAPCAHPLIYQGTCVECEEDDLGAEGQLLHSSISNVRAHGDQIVKLHIDSLMTARKLIIVLDLDHTLIHAQKLSECSPHDNEFEIIDLGPEERLGVKLRPFLCRFLQRLHPLFEIFVYTFGTRKYALAVLALINRDTQLIDVV